MLDGSQWLKTPSTSIESSERQNIKRCSLLLAIESLLWQITSFSLTVIPLPHVIWLMAYCSADSIERAWKILDQIPGRATGAYSHSQVVISAYILEL